MLVIRKNIFILFLIFNFSFLSIFSQHNQTSIHKQIENISKSIEGEIGVAALHIEKNKLIEFNGNITFPMSSTYKLPIATYCLHLIDNGKLNLETTKVVSINDMRRFCFIKPKQELTIRQQIQLMLEKSDNATSDIIFKMVGSGKPITQWLRKNNIKQMRIDRSTLKMIADYSGVTNLGNEEECTVEKDWKLLKNVTPKNKKLALQHFYCDQQDTTTPIEMTNLLRKLHKGELIRPASKDFLLKSMLRCKWKKQRITKLLPPKTILWHKTGSMDKIISDVGILKLPNNNEHLAYAIYTNKSSMSVIKQDTAISNISKLLFDYFSKK
ncbi:MAG: serine hydrolase [bacterium]